MSSSKKNRRKIETGNPGRRRTRASNRAPQTSAQYHAKPERFKETWDRVVTVISKMRSGKTSLQQAAKEYGISPGTVKRWAGSALQKQKSGKWAAKRSDRLLRVLKIPTPEGPREIGVRGSRQATQVAKLWNAIHKFLETGDQKEFAKFRGKFIKGADGVQIPFITDPKELNRLGSAGILNFETLYARTT
jgi:hypothetical protein